jgi:imidazoleglycerol-phosphate dehydratase
MSRTATIERKTQETQISVTLDLDGRMDGKAGGAPPNDAPDNAADDAPDDAPDNESPIDVPDGFFAHMLDALTRHAGFGIRLRAQGDTHVDLHHTVEDTGIVLGEALLQALGERRGIVRFGHAYAPLDEALARVVVDLSGRGFFIMEMAPALEVSWVTQKFPLTLLGDFLQAFADRGRFTMHVDVLRGRNPHHVAEAIVKALALALRAAVAVRGGDEGAVPSTKGTLTR